MFHTVGGWQEPQRCLWCSLRALGSGLGGEGAGLSKFRSSEHSLSSVETAPDAVALWLAEMDWPVAACIGAAIAEYADAGHLSYAASLEFATDSLTRWVRRHYGWRTEERQYRWFSGILHATGCVVLALTEPGDSVMVMTPAYPPMLRVVGELGRRLVPWPLSSSAGDYQVDMAALARLLEREQPKLLIVNTPHNPTGRVLTAAELRTMADIVGERPVYVLSDEVFADIVYGGFRHVPFALAASAELSSRTVTMLSAS